MPSKIIFENREYNKELYNLLYDFSDNYFSAIDNSSKKGDRIRYLWGDKIFMASFNHIELNNSNHELRLGYNCILEDVCARVYDSVQNIKNSANFKPNIIRIASLIAYYVVKLKPFKCIRLETYINKNKKKEVIAEYREEYNSRIGLLFAMTFIEKESQVKFKINRDYFSTFCHTLDYKTVSKAMIIQTLDALVLHATEKSSNVKNKKDTSTDEIATTTKKIPKIK